jgi:hypothetical protein
MVLFIHFHRLSLVRLYARYCADFDRIKTRSPGVTYRVLVFDREFLMQQQLY